MTSIENYSKYLIYNNGDVYSIKRKKFLKLRLDKNGYKRVDLYNDSKQAKTFKIHQLVAIAYLDFILEPDSNLCIDHIDNNITNNYLHNLQIITKIQNTRKAKFKNKNGLMRGVHHYKNKKKNVNKNFKSMININNIRINLGYFESEIEAHNAYIIEFNKLMIGVKFS